MLQNETVDIIIRCHCKYLLSSCNNFVVDYVMRQAYKVTHFIVRESLYRPSPHDAPSYLDFTWVTLLLMTLIHFRRERMVDK